MVSGTISDESGLPLPGATITVEGSTRGVVTDFDGNYSIEAENGEVLLVSYVGYSDQSITVGDADNYSVSLSLDNELEEVVVTSLGITRQKKALGYAVSTVQSEDLEQKSLSDVGRVLDGKVSGIRVTQNNGISGSGTNIIIRGYTSINQSNQPLFIVDGVPFNSNTNNSQAFEDGVTESSRFFDLDPNSIESVSVLKGLSASTLYGSQGRNGVILITTKNGSLGAGKAPKKTEVTISSSVFANQISSLPNYQTNYGGGWNQFPAFYYSNWGANFKDTSSFSHPYGQFRIAELQEAFGAEYADAPYVYKNYNSVEQFFRTGIVSSQNINIRGQEGDTSFNINVGLNDDQGFTPGNSVSKRNFGMGGRSKISDKFMVQGSFNFSNTKYLTPPVSVSTSSGAVGANASVFSNILYNPRSVDLFGLPYTNPNTGGSVYYRSGNDIQNVRWTIENSIVGQDVDRFFGNASFQYFITDDINITYRAGLDTYTEFNRFGQNKGGTDSDYPNGIYRTLYVKNTIWDHTVSINGLKNINDDIELSFNVGMNPRFTEYSRDGLESTNQVAYGKLEHFNFINTSKVQNNADTDVTNDIQIGDYEFTSLVGFFGQVVFDYKSSLYLTLAGRYDQTSTLEDKNNSIFYPSVSVAYDLTSLPLLSGSQVINYLKARVGYGTSAGFPTAYRTRNILSLTASSFVNDSGTSLPATTTNNTLGNENLKPELISEIELGIESSLLNNKLKFDLSVFQKTTTDLIARRDLDPSTGYRSTFINGGSIEVKGIEIDLSATVLKYNNFAWNAKANFYADEPVVKSLPDGIQRLTIAGYTNRGNFAEAGKPYGAIFGTYTKKHSNGQRLVNSANGYYIPSDDIGYIGDPNPDFLSSLSNTFSYSTPNFGTLNFSFEWLFRKGGDVYSATAGTLLSRGVTKDTDFDRNQGWILDGVKEDGTPNDFAITTTNAFWNTYTSAGHADELRIWDGTTIRLNEISLGYVFPKSLLDRTFLGSLSITASGFNLWQKAIYFPEHINFDTNVSSTGVGNGQGFDYLTGPASKRYGISLRATF